LHSRLALLCLVVCGVLLSGCRDDLCRSKPPAFQVDLTLAPGVNGATITELWIELQVAGLQQQKTLDVTGKLDDGATSFSVTVGGAGAGGFQASVRVEARDAQGTVLAQAEHQFPGSGDACNFFLMTLTAPGQDLDGGIDAVVDGAPDLGLPDGDVPDQALDQATLPDQALLLDQSLLPDLWVNPDQAVPDLYVPPDQYVPTDQTLPDQYLPDLYVPPDQAVPDQWVPEPDQQICAGQVLDEDTGSSTGWTQVSGNATVGASSIYLPAGSYAKFLRYDLKGLACPLPGQGLSITLTRSCTSGLLTLSLYDTPCDGWSQCFLLSPAKICSLNCVNPNPETCTATAAEVGGKWIYAIELSRSFGSTASAVTFNHLSITPQ
jgi:hypothetical protein